MPRGGGCRLRWVWVQLTESAVVVDVDNQFSGCWDFNRRACKGDGSCPKSHATRLPIYRGSFPNPNPAWLIVSRHATNDSYSVIVWNPSADSSESAASYLSTNQNPWNKSCALNGYLCVKPVTHNYYSCAKYIHHITTIGSHVEYQPLIQNQWHAIASSCKISSVNWCHSVKDNNWWLITITHVRVCLA